MHIYIYIYIYKIMFYLRKVASKRKSCKCLPNFPTACLITPPRCMVPIPWHKQ